VTEAPLRAPWGVGKAFAVYTGLRAVLFLGSFGLLLVAGANGLAAVFFALVVSSVLSIFLLRTPRNQLGAALAERNERKRADAQRLRSLLDEPPAL